MANELTTLQEQMKERLRGQMAGMVPDEIWTKMIDAEFNHLFKDFITVKDPATQQNQSMTRFQYMIREEIVKGLKEKVKALADEALNIQYDSLTGLQKSEIIGAAVQMNIQGLMAEFMGGVFQRMTMDAIGRMRNGY